MRTPIVIDDLTEVLSGWIAMGVGLRAGATSLDLEDEGS